MKFNLTNNLHDITVNKTVKPNTPTFQKNTLNMNKLHPDTIEHLHVITSSAEVNCHRKINLTQAIISDKVMNELYKMFDGYTDILSKHATDKHHTSDSHAKIRY